MSQLVIGITTGITAFIATNIDDILILMLFFAQVNAVFRPRHIVAGQYLGFTVLIVASLPGFLGGLIVPRVWLGLLGLLPIVIGIKGLLNPQGKESEVQTVAELPRQQSSTSVRSSMTSLLNPQTYSVAAVTVANGGDNIGIYVPLFASSDLLRLGVILIVFFLLVGVWCFLGYQLVQHPPIARILSRYSDTLVPLVLIGLGTFILIESGTLALLPQN